MKKAIALLLLLAVAAAAPALAEGLAFAIGDVGLRVGPGLDQAVLVTVPDGSPLFFWDDEPPVTDDRGVVWHETYYEGDACWFAEADCDLLEYDENQPELVPDIDYDPAAVPGYTEVIGWYGKPMREAAEALGLTERLYAPSEVPLRYRNDAMEIAGMTITNCFLLAGQGYTLYGVHPGMDVETAKQKLDAAGLVFYSEDWCVCYEHLVDETSIIDFDLPTDYNVLLEYNDDNIVTTITLSTYTG